MMEEAREIYLHFTTFLRDFFIRKAKGILNAADFDEEKYENLRSHLDELLPSLSLTEANYIRVYFTDAFIFHLKSGLENSDLPYQRPLSPISTEDQEDTQSSPPKRQKTRQKSEISALPSFEVNNEEESPIESHSSEQRRKIIPVIQKTPQISEMSALSSFEVNNEEQTPIESQGSEQRRKTVPVMQSTPLSVPITVGPESGIISDQQRLERAQADDFIADIIAQINLSPIPQSSKPPPVVPDTDTAQPESSFLINVEQTPVAFLKVFDDVMKVSERTKQTRSYSTRRKPRKVLGTAEPILATPKEKENKLDFDDLCCLEKKDRTRRQMRRAEESFLHFLLMPGKTKNLIKRIVNNAVISEGERDYIPMERIINLSNVMRAHASQRASSIEQPGQISFLSGLRSPCTPQALLRTSQLQPFTPTRGEISSQSPGMDGDQIINFPMRSILRQQPLVTIPERDSLIPITLSPPLEVEIPLNNSLNNIPPLPENLSTIPLDIGEDVSSISNLPRTIPEDIEVIDDQPRISQGVAATENAEVPMQLDEFDAHSLQVQVIPQNDEVPQAETHEDNANISWFEILRPRENISYPRVNGERRNKKKRRRERRVQNIQPRRIYDLQDIALSPTLPNFPALPDDFSHQITENLVANYSEETESEFNGYFELIKEAGKKRDYRSWERFDPFLFTENNGFELYTYIFKRVIKDDYVSMDTLYKEGTTRLEAAKGFRLILEMKTMGFIEIDTVETRIIGFKFKDTDNLHKC